MNIKLSILLVVLLSVSAFGQIDTRNNSFSIIPAEISENETVEAPKRIEVAPKLDTEKEQTNQEQKNYVTIESKKPFNMLETDGLRSPGEIYEQRWRKELVKGGVIRTMSDQFLGEHRVDTKFVNIVCRDHEFPDGDRVRVLLNDDIVKHNLLLVSQYRRVEVNLVQGKNVVDIVALNQGDSGPNTAEFIVYDDKGNVISSKEWNLLTGVKARIVFYNEKVTIKEKNDSSENEASNQ